MPESTCPPQPSPPSALPVHPVAAGREPGAPRLRVLHLGNIANNAFLNARLLNDAGCDCDVLSPDYKHVMGCPEWEEADFQGDVGDTFHPDCRQVDLRGYQRPKWFAQGPFELAALYLIARRDGRRRVAAFYWWILSLLNRQWPRHGASLLSRFAGRLALPLAWAVGAALVWGHRLPGIGLRPADQQELAAASSRGARMCARVHVMGRVAIRVLRLFIWPLAFMVALVCNRLALGVWPPWDIAWVRYIVSRLAGRRGACPECMAVNKRAAELNEVFHRAWPDRVLPWPDPSMLNFDFLAPFLRELFRRYDVVQAYATTGIYPLLARYRPYVAYEHGTIRQMPFENTSFGAQVALAYQLADATCITNADNRKAAETLALSRYVFVPHPVAEAALEPGSGAQLRRELQDRLSADFLVFHPARQHWARDCAEDANWAKANDRLIDGLCRLFAEQAPRGAAIFVEWGQSVAQSKQKISQWGMTDRFHWMAPCHGRDMGRYIDACDVLADQFFLGAFGAIVPKGLALGKPVLCYVDPEMHRWCFPELPPVINVRTADEIYEALVRILHEEDWRKRLASESQDWFRRYHSQAVVRDRLLAIYHSLETTSCALP